MFSTPDAGQRALTPLARSTKLIVCVFVMIEYRKMPKYADSDLHLQDLEFGGIQSTNRLYILFITVITVTMMFVSHSNNQFVKLYKRITLEIKSNRYLVNSLATSSFVRELHTPVPKVLELSIN